MPNQWCILAAPKKCLKRNQKMLNEGPGHWQKIISQINFNDALEKGRTGAEVYREPITLTYYFIQIQVPAQVKKLPRFAFIII
jgi:hypothetical protein